MKGENEDKRYRFITHVLISNPISSAPCRGGCGKQVPIGVLTEQLLLGSFHAAEGHWVPERYSEYCAACFMLELKWHAVRMIVHEVYPQQKLPIDWMPRE